MLFPGGLLPLKVFEQRYVEMAKACLMNSTPVRRVPHHAGRRGRDAGGAAPEIATVGTLARITDWDMPQLGILHVATIGETRFQVRSMSTQPNGLVVGEVTPIAAEAAHAARRPRTSRSRNCSSSSHRAWARSNFPAERDYDDASWVGYRLAELLPLPLHIKQSMLEINDAGRAAQGAAEIPGAAGATLTPRSPDALASAGRRRRQPRDQDGEEQRARRSARPMHTPRACRVERRDVAEALAREHRDAEVQRVCR